MGNTLVLSFSRFSWAFDSGTDSEGDDEEDVVEMEKGPIVLESQPRAENTSLSARELRRRRRLGMG
tara:strand:+ start:723 stop:920 length:198 start_codon:yes stop_codon:yes gene_type:complete